jgi:hypothetical protein
MKEQSQTIAGQDAGMPSSGAPPPRSEPVTLPGTSSVVPYLRLTRDLASVLTPIRPRAEFRAELRNRLVGAARQQQARYILYGSASVPDPSRHDEADAKALHAARAPVYPFGLSEQPGAVDPSPDGDLRPPDGDLRPPDGDLRLALGFPQQYGFVSALPFGPASERSGHRWVWGAAALGSAAVSLSLVGVVAYVVRHRHREAA